MQKIILIVAVVFMFTSALGQKNFKGKITYKVKTQSSEMRDTEQNKTQQSSPPAHPIKPFTNPIFVPTLYNDKRTSIQ